MKVSRRGFISAVGGLSAAALLGACGSESGSGSTGSSASSAGDFTEKGPVTFAMGKDTTGKLQTLIDGWNKSHPKEKATLTELSESADDQRASMIRNFQVKSDAYTVVAVDPIWTAEFAAQQWILPLPENTDTAMYLKSSVDSATYFKKVYGIPFVTNGQMLFYRKDILDAAGVGVPKTWAEMWAAWDKVKGTAAAKGMTAYAGQFAKYEGLTVNFAAAVASAGGTLFNEEGKPTATSDGAKAGLQAMIDGFAKGYIGKQALTYKEEESRQAFQDGKLLFLTNWPYVWAKFSQSDGSSKVAGKFGVAPMPGIGSGTGTTVLGGYNLGISSFAKNKGSALAFAQYMATEPVQKAWAISGSRAPALASLYDDAELIKAMPYTPTLKKTLESGTTRPKVHNYGDVTLAIQNAVYPALGGKGDAGATLKSLQTKLEALSK
ncbi:ABC transporter substrate-binding protein [Acidipropionibacterium virtanenii]|uniref:Putative ABC transporter-binding protein n=1 Tax=Acidipropionibacterium virtanenii TaxID=2057246 RepID=A0A344UQL1_9ACTN|nr:ABC transporter substrate-binding protein [Acidipropionibacterium virtanenii]AXE37559.1 putative ABC transporter-binding protein [Acidipropionibacterium virtanenii]